MSRFALQVQWYLTQKVGNDRAECEDAVAFRLSNNAFAVADGATEAFASRYWSRLLVKSWVRHPSAFQKSSFLELVQRLGERVTERWKNKPLPWYAEERAREGSFAAFVGAIFETENDVLRWRVLAIGDSCFIQTRLDRVEVAFPISEPEQFGFHPLLLPSSAERQTRIAENVGTYEGTAESGDTFYLLSDSVANWYLQGKRTNSAGVMDFELLLARGLTSELDIFFDELRASEQMRNDDIAAVYVRIE
jgi:Protein phosphatase 2C